MIARPERPDWLTVRIPADGPAPEVDGLLRDIGLHTVCEEALCPNIWDCWHRRTATFLVLGDRCTRDCRFCSVRPGKPLRPDPAEPGRVAEAARLLGLEHVVITSVTRDDLPDGGAAHLAACVEEVRKGAGDAGARPGDDGGPPVPATVEVLAPDFRGQTWAVETLAAAAPDVFGHNVETVPRLYPEVRPGAGYRRSLEVLARAAELGLVTKSGLMLGLGETEEEIREVLADLRSAGCALVTVSQYLRPSKEQLPVSRYVPPAEFDALRDQALGLGFAEVAAGPLVRSSYRAAEMLAATKVSTTDQSE